MHTQGRTVKTQRNVGSERTETVVISKAEATEMKTETYHYNTRAVLLVSVELITVQDTPVSRNDNTVWYTTSRKQTIGQRIQNNNNIYIWRIYIYEYGEL